MSKYTELNARLIIATILSIVGSALLISGFVVPPLGIIDSSVLVAFGETSTFIAALLGIDYHYKYKMYAREEKKESSERNDLM